MDSLHPHVYFQQAFSFDEQGFPLSDKTCSQCREIKPIEAFSKQASAKSGYRPNCKECEKQYRNKRIKQLQSSDLVVPDEKCCSCCNKTKPIREFSKEQKSPDGYKSCCKKCCNQRIKARAMSEFPPDKQICTMCRKTKPINEFYRDNNSRDGYQKHCKDCYEEKRNKRKDTTRNPKKLVNVHREDLSTRWCYVCNSEKPIDEFPSDPNARDGRHSHCKECHAAKVRAYNLANKEELALRRQGKKIDYHAHYLRNRLKVLAKNKKRHALKKKVTIEIVSLERVLERDGYHCYICNQEVKPEHLSFDHVIPLKHGGEHSEANLKVTHKICNSRKQARFFEQLTAFDKRGPYA